MTDNELQADVIRFVQGDIPVVSRPYEALAASLAITESDIVSVIQDLKQTGKIRRYGAVLRHQKAGYVVNAMVAWQVPAGQADTIGHQMAACRQVSHLYLRKVPEDFPFNLFSMVHAQTRDELNAIIHDLAKQSGITKYEVLQSVRELKKISMKYL